MNRQKASAPILRIFRSGCALLLVVLATQACTFSLFERGPAEPTLPYPIPATSTQTPETEITFQVEIPENTPSGDAIHLVILDEVTGLALNAIRYTMQAQSAQKYSVTIRVAVGSTVKYRYARVGGSLPAGEHISDGRAVRYRLFHVEGPGQTQDVVTRWNDTPFEGLTGRINGAVVDVGSNQPLPNVLVAAGGVQVLTASDGTYLLEGLPPGTHNLVAVALDGSYRTFQQGATVAADLTTPAPIQMRQAPMVTVTFLTIVPQDTVDGTPVRLAGNLYQLGNTYASLSGGVSTMASRMPALTKQADGRYSISISLPAGVDIRYKFTLGDGFWNAEQTQDGRFRVRQLIVPDGLQTFLVEDLVETWKSKSSSPIWFDVTVPDHTRSGDTIFLQLNPFGWTEPIPMWPTTDSNRWIYALHSPLDDLSTISYRYCRDAQCGSADDLQTAGRNPTGRPVSTSLLTQTMIDAVKDWQWLSPLRESTSVPSVDILARDSNFVAGVAFQAGYHPSWDSLYSRALDNVKYLGANWVILNPTWTYTRNNPPVLEQVAGNDALWLDLAGTMEKARQRNLNVALQPTPRFPSDPDTWWLEAPRDNAWWESWFERYRIFALHHADLASRQGAQTLILGGDWITPALPGGTLPDGNPSNLPANAEARWRELLAEVRSRFDGTLAWALPFPEGIQSYPAFLDSVDQIYVLWSPALTTNPNASAEELEIEAARLVDGQLALFQVQIKKPIILSVGYPSADGGITGCIPNTQVGCLRLEALSRPNRDISSVQLDLQEQVDAYNTLLKVVNSRDWITGFVSRGYYPPTTLEDKSLSIHGKPAADVLWYWFPRLLGITP